MQKCPGTAEEIRGAGNGMPCVTGPPGEAPPGAGGARDALGTTLPLFASSRQGGPAGWRAVAARVTRGARVTRAGGPGRLGFGVMGYQPGPGSSGRLDTMAGRRPRLRVVSGTPVNDALAHMPDTHLLCRDFGHSWRPWTAQWVPQRRQYLEALVCLRCETVRKRLLDEFGAQLGQSYDYADGYLVKGLGRITGDDRNSVRLMGLQAVLRATSEDQPQRAGGGK